MKKVLLVFMVLASLTAIADEAFVGEHGEKQAVCEPCEAKAKLQLEQKAREAGKDVSSSAGKDVKSSGKQSASKQ